MKRIPLLGLALAVTLLACGCARNYNVTLSSGSTITSHGKPKYDKENSCFVFTDARGVPRRIPAGSVREITPASESSSKAGFNPQPSR
jgi:hypothetical protein